METVTAGLLAELACAAPDWDAFERETTPLLMQAIGGDTVFFADPRSISRHALGVITEVRDQVQPLWAAISAEARPVLDAFFAGRTTLIDSEVFGRKLERLPYYDLVMRPVRGRTTLMGAIAPGASLAHKIAIGRCQGSSPFKARHQALLGSLLPTIALARAALRPELPAKRTATVSDRQRALLELLTPREREVLDYLRLGYSNEQIGRALGTRPRTVRNQLSSVYDKLGVANRAEAVGLSLPLDS